MLKNTIQVLRLTHWVKNIFILLPIFFAGKMNDDNALINVVLIAMSFSFLASAVYVMNDVFDKEIDRKHVHKKHKPIASGLMSVSNAFVIIAILLCVSLGLAYWLMPVVLPYFALYFGLNILYSWRLKRIALLDVTIIAVGFVLRVYIGGVAADVPVSSWIVIMTFLIALFLGLGKRRSEFVLALEEGFEVRKALGGYSLVFINYALVSVISVAMVAYLMYCFSPDVLNRLQGKPIYLSFVFVWLGMMRYLQLIIVQNSTYTPTQIMTKDLSTILILVLWGLSFVYFIYL